MSETNFEEKMQQLNQLAQQQDLKDREEQEEKQRELDKKNNNFYMVFKSDGSPLVRTLIKEYPKAAELFLFLCEKADRTNAFIASGKALASFLEMSEPTVSRAIKTLKEKQLIDIFKTGSTNVFVLNPEVVWSAWKTGKKSCMFGNAKVLLSAEEQDKYTQKRINVMVAKNNLELPLEPDTQGENNE
jgi:hypothetical protein